MSKHIKLCGKKQSPSNNSSPIKKKKRKKSKPLLLDVSPLLLNISKQNKNSPRKEVNDNLPNTTESNVESLMTRSQSNNHQHDEDILETIKDFISLPKDTNLKINENQDEKDNSKEESDIPLEENLENIPNENSLDLDMESIPTSKTNAKVKKKKEKKKE